MIPVLLRSGSLPLISACGVLLGWSPAAASAQTVDRANAAVPVASVAPAGPATADLLHTDPAGHHLAPRGTFYLLEYVSVETDKGVEGFEPGQEVHLVEVHRATHTLVVSDGRAQVEVSPAKLTHDLDVAAAVRQKDQANQSRIASYVQAEQTAYNKYEKEAAEATVKDIDRLNDQQKAASRIVDDSGATPAAQTVNSTGGGAGYYANGGYGYGSPYSYFSGGGGTTVILNPATQGTAGTNGGAASSSSSAATGTAGRVAAPSGGGAVGKAR